MEIKSHLFEIMQFCFLHSILLFLYLSVLLRPNFLEKIIYTRFSYTQSQLMITELELQCKEDCVHHPRRLAARKNSASSLQSGTESVAGLSAGLPREMTAGLHVSFARIQVAYYKK